MCVDYTRIDLGHLGIKRELRVMVDSDKQRAKIAGLRKYLYTHT